MLTVLLEQMNGSMRTQKFYELVIPADFSKSFQQNFKFHADLFFHKKPNFRKVTFETIFRHFCLRFFFPTSGSNNSVRHVTTWKPSGSVRLIIVC